MKSQKILFLLCILSLSSLNWGHFFEKGGINPSPPSPSKDYSIDKFAIPLGSQSLGENLYVENIMAEIAQKSSIIHHSRVSNSRNVFGLDLFEPCFSNCSFYFSFTNDVPNPITPVPFSYEKNGPSISNFGFVGFLLYEVTYSAEIVSSLKDRAIELFESQFELNIIEIQNITEENIYYFPFYGLLPNFSLLAANTLVNISIEGFLDSEFLNLPLNVSYSSSHYVQESLYYFHSATAISTINHFWEEHSDTLNFDVHTSLNRIPLISMFNDISDQIDDSNYQSVVSAELGSLLGGLNVGDLLNFPFHVLQVSYSGNSKGIDTSNGDFVFNLHKAVGLPALYPIKLSAECFDSFFGIFSGISIVSYGSNIVDIYPQKFDISSENIVPLQHLLYLASNGTDFSLNFRAYQWKVLFETRGSISQLKSLPTKIQNRALIIEDFFDLFSPFALSFLPCIFLNSIPNFEINYKVKSNPAILKIQKEILPFNSSVLPFVENRTVNISLSVSNLGTSEVWGLPVPDLSAFGINNLSPDNSITDRLNVLGYDTETMFSTAIPRYFPIDLLGQGYFSQIFPNFLNESVRSRYSPLFASSILDNLADLTVHTSYNETQLVEYAYSFNYSYSMFNPLSWVIKPNTTLKIFSQSNLKASNLPIYTLNQARFRFGSEFGCEFSDLKSNSLEIFLNSSSTIKATARLDQNMTLSGENNRYIISLHHSGNQNLTDLEFHVPIVGILVDSGDFERKGKMLSLIVPYFNASTFQTEFSYTFLSPNSLVINSAQIFWDDGSKQRAIYSNEVELFADQYFADKLHVAYLPQLTLDTSISILDNKTLILNCTVSNIGDANVTAVDLLPLFPEDAFILQNITSTPNISLLVPLESYTTVFVFEILLPYAIITPLIWIDGIDSYLYHFTPNTPQSIGTPNIAISKILSRLQGWTGQQVQVYITITNIGDVPIQNLILNDYYGFPPKFMSLIKGVLQKSILLLGVDESFSFNYSLSLDQSGNFELSGAQVKFLYLSPMKITSEVIIFQVRSTSFLIFGLSSSLVFIACGIVYLIRRKRREEELL